MSTLVGTMSLLTDIAPIVTVIMPKLALRALWQGAASGFTTVHTKRAHTLRLMTACRCRHQVTVLEAFLTERGISSVPLFCSSSVI